MSHVAISDDPQPLAAEGRQQAHIEGRILSLTILRAVSTFQKHVVLAGMMFWALTCSATLKVTLGLRLHSALQKLQPLGAQSLQYSGLGM